MLSGFWRRSCTFQAHKVYPLLADWDNWQKFTLQYLDTNNKIVNTQVAVPSEFDLAALAVPLVLAAALMTIETVVSAGMQMRIEQA